MTESDNKPDGLDGQSEPAVLGTAPTVPLRRRPRPARARHGRHSPRRGDSTSRPAAGSAPREASSRDYGDTLYVFEPNSRSLPPLRRYVESLWERRRFMHALAKSGVNQSRANTALGSLWGILDPLFQAAVYYLLFTIIRKGSRPVDFLHILIANIQLFGLTTSAMSDGGNSIRGSKALLLNSAFPRAMLPITSVYKSLLKFAPAVGVYVGVHLFLDAPIGWFLLMLPVLFTIQLAMNLGLALCTATLIVFFRDTRNALNYVTRLLFFTTPIIYPLYVLPDNIRSYLAWQPLFPLFACYQEVLSGNMPSLSLIGEATGWAMLFLAFGAWIFLRHERDFASRII